MKDYKRLTDRDITKVCFDTWELCGLDDVCKRDCRKPEPCKIPQMILRLAELEDKIEAGTLVTVPYAIGQELYWVYKKGYFDVEKVKVSLITIKHDGSVDIRLNHYNYDGSYRSCFKYDPKYYELFDNGEEAEKRWEELRNETKSIDNSDK